MTPLAWVGFVAAGSVGAPARYLVDGYLQRRSTGDAPWGTFAVNVSGAFLLGLLTGFARHHGLSSTTATILGTGFCGAFTTFSTFSVESVLLLEAGKLRQALGNVVGSVACGLIAAAAGLLLASLG